MVNLRITDELRWRHKKSKIPFLPNHKIASRRNHGDLIFGDRPPGGFDIFSTWCFKGAEEQKHFESIRMPFVTFSIILKIRGRKHDANSRTGSWPFRGGREKICPWSECETPWLGAGGYQLFSWKAEILNLCQFGFLKKVFHKSPFYFSLLENHFLIAVLSTHPQLTKLYKESLFCM